MDFLGIGPLELLFIVLIALIVLGPKDMVKAGKTLGRFMRKIVTSPSWRTIQDATKELRRLPNRLIREAGLEDIQKELPKAETIRRELGIDEMTAERGDLKDDLSDWTTPPNTIATPEHLPGVDASPENSAPAQEEQDKPVESQPPPSE